jgi:hypothetical protein
MKLTTLPSDGMEVRLRDMFQTMIQQMAVTVLVPCGLAVLI